MHPKSPNCSVSSATPPTRASSSNACNCVGARPDDAVFVAESAEDVDRRDVTCTCSRRFHADMSIGRITSLVVARASPAQGRRQIAARRGRIVRLRSAAAATSKSRAAAPTSPRRNSTRATATSDRDQHLVKPRPYGLAFTSAEAGMAHRGPSAWPLAFVARGSPCRMSR